MAEGDFMDINKVVQAVSGVKGVQAVVLGGSQSRGEATEHSDYDIGVYYEVGALDTAGLEQRLQALDDGHMDTLLNPPGEWGPWINGGAWLTVDGTPVDILLRDTGRVGAVIGDCLAGNITIDYQCGHPFGFVNTIYAAEVHYCKPLWQDASQPVNALKALLAADGGYPKGMQDAVIRKFLWEAWFSLACARKPALSGETNYAMGSVFRAVCAWAEVLYALNGKFLMNEKKALQQASKMALCPVDMEKRVVDAYALLGTGDEPQAYLILDSLHAEVEALTTAVPPIATHIR
jgi:predicted nucleotidyltransferase